MNAERELTKEENYRNVKERDWFDNSKIIYPLP